MRNGPKVRGLGLSLAGLLLCPGGLWAQTAGTAATQQSGTSAETHEVEGLVVNAVTGAPVGRALVTSDDGRMAEMTDAEGRFRVEVAGGGAQATLMARRPGFLPMNRGAAITAATTRVELQLRPEAVVDGRVVTREGVVARGAQVMLEERRIDDGRAEWVPRGGGQVSMEGAYRIADLAPGIYRLSTREWVADRGAMRDGVPEAGYPPVRYPGTGAGGAEGMRLAAGQEVRVDLRLRAERYFAVEVPVANCGAGAGGGGVAVQVETAAGTDSGMQLGYDEGKGAITGALPRGSYLLSVQCFGVEQRAGVVPLVVGDGPARTAPVTIGAGAVIPVEVREEFAADSTGASGGVGSSAAAGFSAGNGQAGIGGRPRLRSRQGPPAQVLLQRADAGDRGFGSRGLQEAANGGWELRGVAPGTYRVKVGAGQGYVAAATCGGVDLRREPLVVAAGAGAAPIEMTLRDDFGQVSGSAPAGVRQVRLLPIGNEMESERDAGVQDGQFEVGVPPGRWLLLASGADLVPIEFRRAEVERQWESRGVVVEVAPGGKATATVPDLPRSSVGEEAGQ